MPNLLTLCCGLLAAITTISMPIDSVDLIPAPSRSISFRSSVGAVDYPDPAGGTPPGLNFAYDYCMNDDPADQEVSIHWKLTRAGQVEAESEGPIHSSPPACATAAPIDPDLQGQAGGYEEGDVITIEATYETAAGNHVLIVTTYTLTAEDVA